MTSVQKALLAALKSLLGGQSFLQALFALWIRPGALEEGRRAAGGSSSSSRTPSPRGAKKKKKPTAAAAAAARDVVHEFLAEAEALFLGPTEGDGLARFAAQLKLEFRERLHAADAESMLPSFNHLLPSGAETGRYVALDVGGSTLRAALVELRGRGTMTAAAGREAEIVRMDTFRITPEIKLLEGAAFFDWMAMRIKEVLEGDATWRPTPGTPIPLGLAWSFPVEYVLPAPLFRRPPLSSPLPSPPLPFFHPPS